MDVNSTKPPFQFGLRSVFGLMFCFSAGYWLLHASRDALLMLGLVIAYAFTVATILYLDPSRNT